MVSPRSTGPSSTSTRTQCGCCGSRARRIRGPGRRGGQGAELTSPSALAPVTSIPYAGRWSPPALGMEAVDLSGEAAGQLLLAPLLLTQLAVVACRVVLLLACEL